MCTGVPSVVAGRVPSSQSGRCDRECFTCGERAHKTSARPFCGDLSLPVLGAKHGINSIYLLISSLVQSVS